MYLFVTWALMVVAAGLVYALVTASREWRAERLERRALALIDWAAEQVRRTYLQTMIQASADGRVSAKDQRKAHGWIIERALKMAKVEGFDAERALGGSNSFSAHAWTVMARFL